MSSTTQALHKVRMLGCAIAPSQRFEASGFLILDEPIGVRRLGLLSNIDLYISWCVSPRPIQGNANPDGPASVK